MQYILYTMQKNVGVGVLFILSSLDMCYSKNVTHHTERSSPR